MEIKPLGDRIVVKPLEAEKKSKGGIVLPDSAKEKPQEAKVVAVGKGKVLDSGTVATPEVKVGDKVINSANRLIKENGAIFMESSLFAEAFGRVGRVAPFGTYARAHETSRMEEPFQPVQISGMQH